MKQTILTIFAFICFMANVNAQLYVGDKDSIYLDLDSTISSSDGNPPEITYPTFGMNNYNPSSTLTEFLDSHLNNGTYAIKAINMNTIYEMFNTSEYGQHFHFTLNEQDLVMHTRIHDMRSPTYTETSQGENSEITIGKDSTEPIHNYVGTIQNDNDADVRFNVYPDYLYAVIYEKERKKYYSIETLNHFKEQYKLTPVTGDEDILLIYEYSNSKPDSTKYICGDTTTTNQGPPLNKKDPEDLCAPYVLEIIVDVDYDYFSHNGSDVTKTKNKILDNLNIAEAVYSSYFDIIFSINKIHIYTNSTSDIYKNAGSSHAILNTAKAEWTPSASPRDVVMVFTGQDATIPGGVVNGESLELGAICKEPSLSILVLYDVKNDPATTCHELGHLLNLHHEDAYCESYINPSLNSVMCTKLYKPSCWFNSTERTKIISHITNNNSCLGDQVFVNTTTDWIKTYTNDNDFRIFSYWRWNMRDFVRVLDIDGDGIDEVLTIKSTTASGGPNWAMLQKWKCGSPNTWEYVWSNMGNQWIGHWQIHTGDRYFIGDFNGNGKSELLCISGTNKWAMVQEFVNGSWDLLWTNYGNGKIDNSTIRSDNMYKIGKFGTTTGARLLVYNTNSSNFKAELFNLYSGNFVRAWYSYSTISGIYIPDIHKVLSGNFTGTKSQFLVEYGDYASLISYDDIYNTWNTIYTNPNANDFGGWGIPFKDREYLIAKDIDKAETNDEMIFIQQGSGNSTDWAATLDNPNGNHTNWNWGNNGNGNFGFWGLGSSNYFDAIRQNPSFKGQIFAFNDRTKWDNNQWVPLYSVGTLRASFYNNTSNYKKDIEYSYPPKPKTVKKDKLEIISSPPVPLVNIVNPNGMLSINTQNLSMPYTICIYDIYGHSVSLKTVNSNFTSIDLKDLTKGIYIIKVSSSNFNKTQKINNL